MSGGGSGCSGPAGADFLSLPSANPHSGARALADAPQSPVEPGSAFWEWPITGNGFAIAVATPHSANRSRSQGSEHRRLSFPNIAALWRRARRGRRGPERVRRVEAVIAESFISGGQGQGSWVDSGLIDSPASTSCFWFPFATESSKY